MMELNKSSANKKGEENLASIIENMRDGKPRTTSQCLEFLHCKSANNAASILTNIKVALVCNKSPYRLKKEKDGARFLWSLYEKD
jgi:hypothetical protein